MLFSLLPQILFIFSIFSTVLSIPSPEEKTSTLAASSNGTDTRKGVDEDCVLACSHWSVTMGFCRGQYSDFSQQPNVEYTNSFLSCLCVGTNSTGTLGNESIAEAASFCLGCQATPEAIKDDLGTFLGLCQVQQSNGTAWNATQFMPNRYSTANDKSKEAVTGFGIRRFNFDGYTLFAVGVVVLGSWTLI